MITGHKPERRPLALASIQSFRRQTWQNRELYVVNTGQPLLPCKTCAERQGIHEVLVDQGEKTLGDLRNIGFKLGSGPWLIQWDDDDWSHPTRIAEQMEQAHPQRGCVLGSQIRHCMDTGESVLFHSVGGIHGTILHHRDVPHRYPSKARAEDTDFFVAFPGMNVVRARHYLYVRFYHGANTWGREHIIKPNRQPLDERDRQALADALKLFKP